VNSGAILLSSMNDVGRIPQPQRHVVGVRNEPAAILTFDLTAVRVRYYHWSKSSGRHGFSLDQKSLATSRFAESE
jgi:hypothetical protein